MITQTQALSEDDLVGILTEPKNAVVKAVSPHVCHGGRRARVRGRGSARDRQEGTCRKTGARGLRSICEELLQQTMFDLPSEQGVSQVVVTAAAVHGDEQPRRVYEGSDIDLD